MKRNHYWKLTVSYWPNAAEAGVSPVEARGFHDDGPQFHRPSEFEFDNPPSRADFLAACKMMYWTSVWEGTLFPVLASNPWPMISYAKIGASVDLVDSAGKVVGRLEIRQYDRWENRPYNAPFITWDTIQRAASIRNNVKDAARKYIDAHEHEIMEALASLPNWSDADLLQEIRKSLMDGGFLKSGRRRVERAATVAVEVSNNLLCAAT